MNKVGDDVSITVNGPQVLAAPGGSPSISIPAGGAMQVPGKIVRDLGTHWEVQLSISMGGFTTIVTVPK